MINANCGQDLCSSLQKNDFSFENHCGSNKRHLLHVLECKCDLFFFFFMQSSAYMQLWPQSCPLYPLPGGEKTYYIHPLWAPLLLGVYHRVVQHQGQPLVMNRISHILNWLSWMEFTVQEGVSANQKSKCLFTLLLSIVR